MTTEYFAELTGHTIEEAETLLKWAFPLEVWLLCPPIWHYGKCIDLQMWLHDQTILAIRAGGGKVNET